MGNGTGGREPQLPAEVEQLIQDFLATFSHVEALLLLAGDGHARHAEAVAAEIHASTDTVSRVLDQLTAAGLLARGASGFVYAPRTEGLRAAVQALSVMFETKPVTLVRAVYGRPSAAVRTFSESFRLRGRHDQEDEDG